MPGREEGTRGPYTVSTPPGIAWTILCRTPYCLLGTPAASTCRTHRTGRVHAGPGTALTRRVVELSLSGTPTYRKEKL